MGVNTVDLDLQKLAERPPCRFDVYHGAGIDIVSPQDLAERVGAGLAWDGHGRITRSARRTRLHIAEFWPWATDLATAFTRLGATPARMGPPCPHPPRNPARSTTRRPTSIKN
jgi:hypothetical protein